MMRDYRVHKRVVFCAAHSIKGAGKCENKHGHNWVATIDVAANTVDDRGFISDVRDIKQAAHKYDHDDLDKYFDFPSTENVAAKIADDVLEGVLANLKEYWTPDTYASVKVHLVETENNSATAYAEKFGSEHEQLSFPKEK